MTPAATAGRDRGSVLTMTLVMMVVASLVVLPLLRYSITVFAANRVVAKNTAEAEAARAGLRVALADPIDTYRTCSTDHHVPLAGPGLDVATTTTCTLLGVAGTAETEQIHAVASTAYGAPPMSGDWVVGEAFAEALATESDWVAFSSPERDIEGGPRVVWTPHLPVHARTLRSSAPYELPDDYPLGGISTCDVFFPGTYTEPVELSGPTYLASGVYYFEDEVRVVADTGASGDATDVVAGQGDIAGCINDTGAWFSVVEPPELHNVTGKGATFVLGADARLVIDNADGPVSFRMNPRYADATTSDGSAEGPSIMTVNGIWDDDSSTFDDLSVPGELFVPRSFVDAAAATAPAVDHGYQPSTLTPAAREPGPPGALVATPRDGGAVFSWQSPDDTGGEPVTSYLVELVDTAGEPVGPTCAATETTACAIADLTNDATVRARVTATNPIGTSEPTATVEVTPAASHDAFTLPAAPTGIAIDAATDDPGGTRSAFSDAFVVRWEAPSETGHAPISSYEVEVVHDDETHTCSTAGATTCVVTGVVGYEADDPFTIAVRAGNIVGRGAPATAAGFVLTDDGTPYVDPEPGAADPYSPPAVIAIGSDSSTPIDVEITGYVAVPQGVVSIGVADPASARVELSGGVLAAWFEIAEPYPAAFVIGIGTAPTQRRISILTRVDGSAMQAEAVVQINESGAWAVNSWVIE